MDNNTSSLQMLQLLHTQKTYMSHTSQKILVIDDDFDNALSTKDGREWKRGFTNVDVFTDSISALNNYRPDYYDMIAVNVRVPRMDGFELYKEIKERDNQVWIWFLSAPVENTYEEFRQIHPGLEENRVIRK